MIEESLAQIRKTIDRYHRVQESDELAEYFELKEIVESRDFVEKKRKLVQTKYRNTSYYSEGKEYEQAAGSYAVRRWKHLNESQNLKEYLEFEQTKSYYLLQDRKAVLHDSFLRRMWLVDHSFSLREYKRIVKSQEVKAYQKLKPIVEDEDWKEQNAFWKDENRWHRTPEGRQDARYEQLSQDSDIVFYLAQDPKQIEEWESYKALFREEFLDKSNWDFGFPVANKNARTDLSVGNEEAAMNNGHNTAITGYGIQLEVRKESLTMPALDQTKGMIKKDYEYTGDVMHTTNHYTLSKGLIVAKVRFTGKIDGVLCLTANNGEEPIILAKADGKNDWKEITYELNSKTAYAFTAKAYLKAGKKCEGKMEIAWIYVYGK